MKLPKHHYIPVFYLKKWARPDGRVVEFSRPYGNVVRPRYVHPDGTGYVRGLYRLPGASDETAELIETRFFKEVDDSASYAQLKILRKSMQTWDDKTRSAWTRFLIGLLVRSPKTVQDVKDTLSEGLPDIWQRTRERMAVERPDEPPLGEYSRDQVNRTAIINLQRFINNPDVGNYIANMYWTAIDVSRSKYRFMTSDRPVIMTNGFNLPNSHIALPVSPTMIFVAARTVEMSRSISGMTPHEIVSSANSQVVRHAIKYVWGTDQSQVALIHKQMSADAASDRNFFRDVTTDVGL